MATDRWTTSNTTVYNIGYHIIWCPKYRRKVLVGDVEARLKQLLQEKADKIGVSIEEINVKNVGKSIIKIILKIPKKLKGKIIYIIREDIKMEKETL